ncbi:MAG: hypothetical protein OXG95_06335 [Chloroflexi bacterium]|nr:hypothetical protein [Chloroflexota bacterium]
MAFDAERAARRLTDAVMEQRAANGVVDVVATATTRLATEASLNAGLSALREELAGLRVDMYRALWLQGMGILGAIVAATGIILAAMRLWM